jgi:hypothetical protein
MTWHDQNINREVIADVGIDSTQNPKISNDFSNITFNGKTITGSFHFAVRGGFTHIVEPMMYSTTPGDFREISCGVRKMDLSL